MPEPQISIIQAVIVVVLAVLGLLMSFLLWSRKKQNGTSSGSAIFVISSLSIWLLANVLDDRTTNVLLCVQAGRLTYAIPYLVLLSSVIFSLSTEPVFSRTVKLTILTIATLITIAGVGIAMWPRGLVLYFDQAAGTLSTHTSSPWFYIAHTGYLLLLLMCSLLIRSKWPIFSKEHRTIFRIAGAGLLATTLLAIFFSVLSAFNVTEHYVYYYSYLSASIFLFSFTYAILRHGAFGASVSISRRVASSVSGLLVIGVTLGLVGYGLITLENQASTSVVRLTSLVAAMALGVVVQQIIEYLQKHRLQNAMTNLGNNISDTQIFLRNIVRRYGLIGATWRQSDGTKLSAGTCPTVNKIFSAEATGRANTIDISRRIATKIGLASTHESGPQRCALIIPASGGIFFAGRKRLNIAFSEGEVRSLVQDVRVHAAELEIDVTRRARENHLAELEQLTEQRSKEIALSNAVLYKRFRERALFFKMIAEELRTPLTVLNASLESGTLSLPKENLTGVKNASRQLLELSQELALSGSQATTGLTTHTWLSLDEFIRTLAATYQSCCAAKQMHLQFDVKPVGSAVAIKRVHLEQMVGNLLGNAISYSPKQTSILCHFDVLETGLEIKIFDTGHGIPDEEKPLIFEPFFRASTSRETKGSGLGLSVVRNLVQNYRGKCEVTDNKPHGTVFTLWLPVKTRIET
ncbi:MAG: HAMP domain-containing sensor histidine kinase [Parcubacteria group bacterium]